MENQFYDQQYLKLCSIADKEGRAFACTALEYFADRESLQMFLNSLFYNHSIMESDLMIGICFCHNQSNTLKLTVKNTKKRLIHIISTVLYE
jgi:thymidine kinase